MKKYIIDILVIAFATVYLVLMDQFNLLEKSAKFMLIPILVFYYLGKYIGKNFKNQS